MRPSIPLLLFTLGACSEEPAGAPAPPEPAGATFHVLAGSENKDLQPLLEQFAAQNHVTLTVDYAGSVDIALQLQSGRVDADAILPASSFWVDFADKKKIVKDRKSIMRSPVVYGVKMSVAKELGWVGNPGVTVKDILAAGEGGHLRLAMTSATQSNSGAMGYFGVLSAFAGNPDVLQRSHLDDPAVQDSTRKLLATIDRASGSSGYLKDLMVADEGRLDAMVNYETMVIVANRELVAQGKEPLCAVYPSDGMSIADFPLGYIDHGDAAKAQFFASLQAWLLSDPTRAEIEKLGRRAGAVGMELSHPDPTVFNPDWCIDTTRTISPVPMPDADVTQHALELFQTLLRKPSYTVYVVDYSGSMGNDGREKAMKDGMETVLEPTLAARYWLQPSARDITVVVPFDDHPRPTWRVEGDGVPQLRRLVADVKGEAVGGGTGLYEATVAGLDTISAFAAQHPQRDDAQHLSKYHPAVVLMTDGQGGDDPALLTTYLSQHPELRDVPVFAVQFGEASADQLVTITGSKKNVFDGSTDLASAIRKAKGNN